LRLPELSELGNDVRLRSLQAGSVEVDASGAMRRISLLELRPGIGSARLVVPPTINCYNVTPRGVWPSSISQTLWRGVARGLNPRGTIFRMRRGEWVRLKEDSAVELGEELRVVAESRNSPPACCSPQGVGVVIHNRLNWRMWRIVLPIESSPAVERWAEALGVVLLEPVWNLTILSIPHAFDSTRRVPVFGINEALIAKVKSPKPGAQSGISLNISSSSQTITISTASDATAFLAFSAAWPSTNDFLLSNRKIGWFETKARTTVAELQEILRTVPILRVTVGEYVVQAWTAPLEIPAPSYGADPPDFGILPELDDLRLGLSWEGSDGVGREEGLTRDSIKNRLREFWGKEVEVRICAGALGWVGLRFCAADKRGVCLSNDRVLRWASFAAKGELRSSGAWILRSASVTDKRLLLEGNRRTDSRWIPLAVRHLKEPKD
jgi:hypothetical protein